MVKITLGYSNLLDREISTYKEKVKECHIMLHQWTGPGSDYLGWVDLPNNYDRVKLKE